ncbi:hypothetical protein ANCCEY_07084 [Ancylostoma ceylanicum]|uniref:Uncharacterized protein n=1 Tax=Ancylostoma ceylanicum TaxID=53326 RepID=A0A0D6LRM5_9BILA|nr:hypothetical protein ANCCEY_07084 [Ancylostoma ceylanicum]
MENDLKEELSRRRRAAWAAFGPLGEATDQLTDHELRAHLFDSTCLQLLLLLATTQTVALITIAPTVVITTAQTVVITTAQAVMVTIAQAVAREKRQRNQTKLYRVRLCSVQWATDVKKEE